MQDEDRIDDLEPAPPARRLRPPCSSVRDPETITRPASSAPSNVCAPLASPTSTARRLTASPARPGIAHERVRPADLGAGESRCAVAACCLRDEDRRARASRWRTVRGPRWRRARVLRPPRRARAAGRPVQERDKRFDRGLGPQRHAHRAVVGDARPDRHAELARPAHRRLHADALHRAAHDRADRPRRPSRRYPAYDRPMQRSDELAPLSREHHVALEVALRLRRASEDDAAECGAAFLTFFEDEAREHFRAEEELLLPAFARHAPADDPDVVRVLVEHVELRRPRAGPAAPAGALAALHALGELLTGHVRHEERTLFPRDRGGARRRRSSRRSAPRSPRGAARTALRAADAQLGTSSRSRGGSAAGRARSR